MTLIELSHTILLINKRPISKVRLARVIYFVHKELVRKKLMQSEDIKYLRSPLGPVPEAYLSLRNASEKIISQKNVSSNLSYTSEEYRLDESAFDSEAELLEQYRDTLKIIEKTLRQLNLHSTPALVELSQHEPSWLAHSNGELYNFTAADLRVYLPVTTPIRIKIGFNNQPINKSGAMQANLLRGMIGDIVRESTDLEYPDDPSTNEPPKPLSQIFRIKFFGKWLHPDKKASHIENSQDQRGIKDSSSPDSTSDSHAKNDREIDKSSSQASEQSPEQNPNKEAGN